MANFFTKMSRFAFFPRIDWLNGKKKSETENKYRPDYDGLANIGGKWFYSDKFW